MRMRTLLLAEFEDPRHLVEAARTLRLEGHRDLDTYSPFPVDGVDEALGLKRSPVPLIVLVCALAGVALGYGMQYWANAVDYPINVGGRPAHAPPAFIPITFELGVLFGALGAFVGLLALFRFPQLFFTAHTVEAFRSATLDGFWLSMPVSPGPDRERLARRLVELGGKNVSDVSEDMR